MYAPPITYPYSRNHKSPGEVGVTGIRDEGVQTQDADNRDEKALRRRSARTTVARKGYYLVMGSYHGEHEHHANLLSFVQAHLPQLPDGQGQCCRIEDNIESSGRPRERGKLETRALVLAVPSMPRAVSGCARWECQRSIAYQV